MGDFIRRARCGGGAIAGATTTTRRRERFDQVLGIPGGNFIWSFRGADIRIRAVAHSQPVLFSHCIRVHRTIEFPRFDLKLIPLVSTARRLERRQAVTRDIRDFVGSVLRKSELDLRPSCFEIHARSRAYTHTQSLVSPYSGSPVNRRYGARESVSFCELHSGCGALRVRGAAGKLRSSLARLPRCYRM